MIDPCLNSKKRKRDHLVNMCNNGHDQSVHCLYCSNCGEKIERKKTERSWNNIIFEQSAPFSLLLDLENFTYDEAFFSAFNTSILLITNNRQAVLLRDIDCGEDEPGNIMDFMIPTVDGDIENVVTDNRMIFIQSEGKLWSLDWVDLLNNNPHLSEVTITGKMRELIQTKYIYASTAKQILEITANAKTPINNNNDAEIVGTASYEDNILVITRSDDGRLFVQTNTIRDRKVLTQELLIRDEVDKNEIVGAIGARYYAVYSNSNILQIGSLSKLTTSQRPEYTITIEENIEQMFFVKDYLYTISNNAIHQWDLNNFIGKPEFRRAYVNSASMKPIVNFEHGIICIPIRQGQNEYLEIVDLNLAQRSRSFAFPQPLKAFGILNNQVFALTQEVNHTKIYIG